MSGKWPNHSPKSTLYSPPHDYRHKFDYIMFLKGAIPTALFAGWTSHYWEIAPTAKTEIYGLPPFSYKRCAQLMGTYSLYTAGYGAIFAFGYSSAYSLRGLEDTWNFSYAGGLLGAIHGATLPVRNKVHWGINMGVLGMVFGAAYGVLGDAFLQDRARPGPLAYEFSYGNSLDAKETDPQFMLKHPKADPANRNL